MNLLVACVLLAQNPGPEEVLHRLQERIEKARTLQVTYTCDAQLKDGDREIKANVSGILLLKDGGRMSFLMTTTNWNGRDGTLAVICDGKGMRKSGDPSTRAIPPLLLSNHRRGLSTAGIIASMVLTDDLAAKDYTKVIAVSAVREGPVEKEARNLTYTVKVADSKAEIQVTVWLDSKSSRLVRRKTDYKDGAKTGTLMETYSDFVIDADLGDDKFSMPDKEPAARKDLLSRQIARIPDGTDPWAPVFSRDGSVVAYLSEGNDKTNRFQVFVGDKLQYSGSGGYPPQISADGKVVAYGIQNNRRWTVVVGSKKSEEYDGLLEIALSRDGKRVAYGAMIGTKCSLVVDGVKGEAFDLVWDATFSADGSSIACFAGFGKVVKGIPGLAEGKSFVVVNGKRGDVFDETRNLVVSSDGKRVAFAGRKGRKWVAVLDGKIGSEFDDVSSPAFSADGKAFGFVARDGDKAWPFIGGMKVGPGYGFVGQLVFSADGKTHAYLAGRETETIPGLQGGFVVVGGKQWRAFDRVDSLFLSQDGAIPVVSTGTSVAVGESEFGPYPSMYPPVFSPDGKTLGFGVREGNAYVWKTISLK